MNNEGDIHFDSLLDRLLCFYRCTLEGEKGYIAYLSDESKIFFPTPTLEIGLEMWEEVKMMIMGSPEFVIHMNSVIRSKLLHYTEIQTNGEYPSLVFHFKGGATFTKPYEDLDLLHDHHLELTKVLVRLQDHQTQTPAPKTLQ